MRPVRKGHVTKNRGQTRRWIVMASVLVLAAALLAVAYVWYPRNTANSPYSQPSASPSPTSYQPPAFKAFTDHYLGIMQSLNSSTTKAKIAPLLNPSYNQTSLFTWEHSRLTLCNRPRWLLRRPNSNPDQRQGHLRPMEHRLRVCLLIAWLPE